MTRRVHKKKPQAKHVLRPLSATTKGGPDGLGPLISEVRDLILSARRAAAAVIDTLQVMTNFEIGHRIVMHEQKGAKRAAYGTGLLKSLSQRLTVEFGRGFSEDNLSNMRKFFLLYEKRVAGFPNNLSGNPEISGQPIRKSPFTLSWTHYQVLITVKNPAERSFYEIEATNAGWSVPELKRQKASSLYERLALSRDKPGIKRLAREGQLVTRPEDLFKEPLVLEFLGLEEKAGYSESDLEGAIISNLEQFLLELGKGFLFEARQKRFTFDADHYFVDLVFYNRLLHCYVLIDLKLDKLTHQDLGQMQMYVNYYDRQIKLPQENPTIGLLLCKSKKQTLVELTLPKDANIHAREYELYLPSKEMLTAKLNGWTHEVEGRA